MNKPEAESKSSESAGASCNRDRDLFDRAPVGLLALDPEGAIVDANLTSAQMLGVECGKLTGAKLADFVGADDRDRLFFFCCRIFASGTRRTCELAIHQPDATQRNMRLEGSTFQDESDAAPLCRIALIDITGEEAAEKWKALATQVLEMVERLPVGAVYVDRERLQMNRAAEEITGYAMDELTTLDQWFETLYGPRCQEIRQLYDANFASGFRKRNTVRLTRKDGEERMVAFAGHRFNDHAVWIFNDVTERERAVELLRKSEERMRSILNAAADAIITVDLEGAIISTNPATERIFAYGESELLGRNVNLLMPSWHWDKHGGDGAGFEASVGGREVMGRRKDGASFPAEVTFSAVDHLGIYTGIIRDVSVRRRAVEGLRNEHQFSENLIETTQSIILVLDPDGRIIRFNSVLEGLTGRKLDEFEGADWFDTFLPERDRDRLRERFYQAIHGEPTRGNVSCIVTRAGEEREIEWYDAPLRDADDQLIGLICNGIDVTERRILEQEVYRSSEEEKIRIASDLHDSLGSMLTGISYLTGALSGKLHRGEAVDASEADAILKNIHQAIGQTRALARGLHGVSDDPDALPVALRELVAKVRSESQLICRFIAPARSITISNPIVANHVFRIAQEAVNNAMRHSGATHLTIRIGNRDDHSLLLSVKDNGCGLDTAKSSQGLGLHTMDYRARAINARLTVRRRRKAGTAVECVFSSR